MSWEIELFNLGNVIVTDKRLSIGDRNFSMDTIRNAEVIYRSRTWMPVFSLLLAAAAFELSGVSLHKPVLQVAAVAFLMLTATLFWKGGPRYSVAISTREGYIQALTSTDRFLVESVGQVVQMILGRSQAAQTLREQQLWLAAGNRSGFVVKPGKGLVAADGQQAFQATLPARVYRMQDRAHTRHAV